MSEVKYFRWTPDGMVEWMAHPDLCAVGVFVRHETFQRHVADELPACKVLAHDLYRRECETSRQLRDEVARLRGVLERIAKYGDNGICPYGCDTPHIAQVALTPQGGGKSCAHPRTQWYSGQYEKTLECLDCRVELDERKL